MNYWTLLFIGSLSLGTFALGEDNHDHEREKAQKKPSAEAKAKSHEDEANDHEGEEHAHGDEKAHGDEHSEEGGEEGEHGHNEHSEGGSQVGPDKGILEASEDEGIRLSPEATKNFGLKTQALTGPGPWKAPLSAVLTAGEEVNVYRVRSGHYKRIDFRTHSKDETGLMLSSRELRAGDEIVTEGVGFLRIAEITAFGGAPEGHSH